VNSGEKFFQRAALRLSLTKEGVFSIITSLDKLILGFAFMELQNQVSSVAWRLFTLEIIVNVLMFLCLTFMVRDVQSSGNKRHIRIMRGKHLPLQFASIQIRITQGIFHEFPERVRIESLGRLVLI